MPPYLALIVCCLGILGLFVLNRSKKSQVSPALWIPTVWLALSASRTVSQWLGVAPIVDSPDQVLEGNPVDRIVFTGLLIAGLAVLLLRTRRTTTFLRLNWPILAFFLYCLASVLWSDFPLTSFKRWTKAIGNVVMILVVLTDSDPAEAVRRFLTRPAFVLLPLSIVFSKYFPELGRVYHRWSGEVSYQGVSASGKNGLGALCMVFGLAVLWQLLGHLRTKERLPRGPLLAQAAVLAITLWLFWLADSVTSLVCFLFGALVIIFTNLPKLGRKSVAVHVLIWGFVVLTVSVLFLGIGTGLIEMMGRDTTLTGRTDFWADVLRLRASPWVGTGFESYWLGERANYFWENYWWHPNQAHNGYLELYVNLGWIGVVIYSFIIVWGYRNAFRAFMLDPTVGQLKLTYFIVAVVYNITEAAFRGMSSTWVVFLMAIMAVPKPRDRGQE